MIRSVAVTGAFTQAACPAPTQNAKANIRFGLFELADGAGGKIALKAGVSTSPEG